MAGEIRGVFYLFILLYLIKFHLISISIYGAFFFLPLAERLEIIHACPPLCLTLYFSWSPARPRGEQQCVFHFDPF